MTHDYRRPMEPLPGFGDEPADEDNWPADLAEPQASEADVSDGSEAPTTPPTPEAPAAPAVPAKPGLATVILADVGELQGGMVRAPLEDRLSGVPAIDDGSAAGTPGGLVGPAQEPKPQRPPKAASAGGSRGNLWFVLGIMAVLFVAGGGAFLLGAFKGSGTGIVTPTPTPTPSVEASVDASVEPSVVPSDSTEPSAVPTDAPTAAPTDAPTATPAPTPVITAGPGQFIYVVKVGETLSDLASRFGVTVEAIVAANHLPDKNLIITGQHLIIPAR